MVFYVAFVALLNLGLGYLVAVYLERGERRLAYARSPEAAEAGML